MHFMPAPRELAAMKSPTKKHSLSINESSKKSYRSSNKDIESSIVQWNAMRYANPALTVPQFKTQTKSQLDVSTLRKRFAKGGAAKFICSRCSMSTEWDAHAEWYKRSGASEPCGKCHATCEALAKKQRKAENMAQVLDARNNKLFWWPDNREKLNVESIAATGLSKAMSKESFASLMALPEFILFLKVDLFIRRLHIDCPPPANPASISGASCPAGWQPKEDQILSNTFDSMGLVTWQTNNGLNFAFIGSSGLSNECIAAVAAAENESWMDKTSRGGSAGGVLVPTHDFRDDPKKLSAATKFDRVYFCKLDNESTNVPLVYKSNNGKLTKMPALYSDLHASKVTSYALRRLAKKNPVHQERLIKQCMSRFHSMIAVEHYGLLDGKGDYDGKNNSNINFWGLDTAVERAATPKIRDSWLATNTSLSNLDIVFLEWACDPNQEELHNHFASAAHQDGGKSYPLESMQLFGKIASNEVHPSSTTRVDRMEPGMLIFPFEGFVLRLRGGRDTAHLNLRDTQHLADRSRGVRNYTIVVAYSWARDRRNPRNH